MRLSITKTKRLSRQFLSVALCVLGIHGAGFGTQLSIGNDFENPILDPLLLQHSLYGRDSIYTNWGCKTPENGLVGTLGKFSVGGTTFQSVDGVMVGDLIRGGSNTITNNCVLEYKTNSVGSSAFNVVSGNLQQVADLYGTDPQLPNLSGVSFSGGATIGGGLTHIPGHYAGISANSSLTINLMAGVYYFNELTLGWQSKIVIHPDANGNYKTIIYVNTRISLANGAQIIPVGFNNGVVPVSAQGKILILYKGIRNVDFVSPSIVVGTLIAPNAQVRFNDGSQLFGQALAKSINLIGFNGGDGLHFQPIITSTLSIKEREFEEERDGTTWTQDKNNSYDTTITIELSTAVPAGNTVTIDYTLKSGSATLEVDFKDKQVIAGKVTFNAGQKTAKISIRIIDDNFYEVPETFTLELSNADITGDNYTIPELSGGKTIEHTITIISDDPQNQIGSFEKSSNIKEYYTSVSTQTVGTVVTSLPNLGTVELVGVTDATGVNRVGWFVMDGKTLKTESSYDADYENNNQRIFTATFKLAGQADEKSYSFSVNPWNDNKTAVQPDDAILNEGASVLISVLANDADADLPADKNRDTVVGLAKDSTESAFSTIRTDRGATVTIEEGKIKYDDSSTPTATETFTDFFYYTHRDSADYGYTTDHFDQVVRVDIILNNIDDNSPVLQDSAVTLFENESILIPVTHLITDVDNLVVPVLNSANASGSVSGAVVSVENGQIRYNLTGVASTVEVFTDEITYTVDGGNGRSDVSATIAVTIKPVNDNAIVAQDAEYTINEGQTLNKSLFDGATDRDLDANQNTKRVKTNSIPGGATGFSVDPATGVFTYPHTGAPGNYTFDFTLQDSATYAYNSPVHTSAEKTITIIVNPVNKNVPTAKDTLITLDENAKVSLNLLDLGLIDDLDLVKAGLDEVLSVSIKSGIDPSHEPKRGTASANKTSITYVHGNGNLQIEYPFYDTLTYTVTDAVGNTDTAEIVVDITPKNDNVPVAVNDEFNVFVGVTTEIYPVGNDTDVDQDKQGGSSALRIRIIEPYTGTLPSGITINHADDQTFDVVIDATYDPTISGNVVTFTYYIDDPVTYDSTTLHEASATITLNIATMEEGTPVLVPDTYTLNEGATIDIAATHGVFENDYLYNFVGQQPTNATVVSSDSTKFGVLTLSDDGSFTYVHDGSENFVDGFSYRAISGGLSSRVDGRVTINVAKRNDNVPVIVGIKRTINEGETIDISLFSSADTDVDVETTLKATEFKRGTGSSTVGVGTPSLVVDDDVLKYSHSAEIQQDTIIDTILVTVKDPTEYCSIGTTNNGDGDKNEIHSVTKRVIITILPVNSNKPERNEESFDVELRENGSFVSVEGSHLSSFVTDADGDTLTFSLSAPATFGTAVVNPDGSFSYVNSGLGIEEFADTFDVKVSDGVPAHDLTLRVPITILPQNDERAVGEEKPYSMLEGDTLIITANAGKKIGLAANATDADRSLDVNGALTSAKNRLRVELVENEYPRFGAVTVTSSDGSFNYINNGEGIEEPADTFYYRLVDSTTYHLDTLMSDSVMVILTIENVNDEKPIAVDDLMTVAVGESTQTFNAPTGNYSSVMDNDSDMDTPRSEWSVRLDFDPLKQPKFGEVTLDLKTGECTYTHNNSENYADTFSYILSDGKFADTAWVYITITKKMPTVAKDAAQYEDVNADGRIDRVALQFDYSIDRAQTDFAITFGGEVVPVDSVIFQSTTTQKSLWVMLSESAMPENRTSGIMSISITHKDFADKTVKYDVLDAAAPVIISANYGNSLDSDEKDTLRVEFSEDALLSIADVPFVIISPSGTDSVLMKYDQATISGNVHTLLISTSFNDMINLGDSIYVNPGDAVTDNAANEQSNPKNIRRPIDFHEFNSVTSASYHDTSDVQDGYIDVIRVVCAASINDEQLFLQLKEVGTVQLSQTRGFTIDSITSSTNGFDIWVVEDTTKNPVTSVVDSLDRLIVDKEIVSEDGLFTLNSFDLAIADSLAPVILEAYYSAEADADTTLDVVFSEPVNGSKLSGNPYQFKDLSTGEKYDMDFKPGKPSSVTPVRYRYVVESVDVDYPITGDSLHLYTAGEVFDTLGNEQSLTVWAPLIVTSEYEASFELYVVPNPLVLENNNGRHTPKEMDQDMMTYFNIDPQTSVGSAFILEGKGPLADPAQQSGSFQIFDQTGNAVTDVTPLRFSRIDGGRVVGVAVWDGKNTSGRVVGAQAYLAIVEVEAVFEDRDTPVVQSLRKSVMVTTARIK